MLTEDLGSENDNEKQQLNPDLEKLGNYSVLYIVKLTFVSAVGGFLFGYDTGVIAGANLYLGNDFPNITDTEKEWVVSVALLGAATASLFGGVLSDKIGRKKTIILADIFFTVGAILMATAPTIPVLMIGRFIVGLGVGLAAMVVPVYLSESAPREIRGKLVSINSVFVTGAQFSATLICLALRENWRLMLGLAGVPSILQLIGIMFLPETAPWLQSQEKHEEAKKSLARVFTDEQELELRMKEIEHEANTIKQQQHLPYSDQLKSLAFGLYKKCLLVGCCLQIFQQLAGINTAMYYGPDILLKAFKKESDKRLSLVYNIPISGMNALGSLLCVFWIDKLGRRYIILRLMPFIIISLLLISLGFYLNYFVVSDTSQFGTYFIFFSILAYIGFFSIGLGSTPWTVNSEIYPLHLRGAGNSLASFSNWISNLLLASFFLTLTSTHSGAVATFAGLAVITSGGMFFVYKMLPETKGKTLEQIIELFTKNNRSNKNSIDNYL